MSLEKLKTFAPDADLQLPINNSETRHTTASGVSRAADFQS